MVEPSEIEHWDVVIVGAGISGIAAAVELQKSCSSKTFVMLEMRESVGGTWDLFRYPGIRSDSDMYTLGYGFKPWTHEKAIAPASAIRGYLRETVEEFGLADHLRLKHRLAAASWSTDDKRWTLTVEVEQRTRTLTCGFLYLGAGYYSHKSGYNPPLPGEADFRGPIIHPQEWPGDLDYAGKRIAVIGSGATAVTLIPSLARDAAKVTMVQRSPGYVHIESDADEDAERWRRELGPEGAFRAVRMRNAQNQQQMYKEGRTDPETFKKMLFDAIEEIVGPEIRERHFTPGYEPFDQRVCVVPNGDLFHAIRDGRADVVTGAIKTLTARGVLMESGEEVEADIIVKATGLNLTAGGDATYEVDGAPVRFGDCWTYKGLAYSGVPNLFHGFGFFNASWTLRVELVNSFWCRVLTHMDEVGAAQVTPRLRPEDESMPRLPYIADVTSGFFVRGFPHLSHQGDHAPWVNPQNLALTVELMAEDPDDGVLIYE
jgi:monooxygenase